MSQTGNKFAVKIKANSTCMLNIRSYNLFLIRNPKRNLNCVSVRILCAFNFVFVISFNISELLIHGIKTTRFFRQRLSDLNQYLEVEVSALNALVYRNSNRFHNDKGFKDVR